MPLKGESFEAQAEEQLPLLLLHVAVVSTKLASFSSRKYLLAEYKEYILLSNWRFYYSPESLAATQKCFGTNIKASVTDNPTTFTSQMENLPAFWAWRVLLSDPVCSLNRSFFEVHVIFGGIVGKPTEQLVTLATPWRRTINLVLQLTVNCCAQPQTMPLSGDHRLHLTGLLKYTHPCPMTDEVNTKRQCTNKSLLLMYCIV